MKVAHMLRFNLQPPLNFIFGPIVRVCDNARIGIEDQSCASLKYLLRQSGMYTVD